MRPPDCMDAALGGSAHERSGRGGEGNAGAARRNIRGPAIAIGLLLLSVIPCAGAQLTDSARTLVRGVVLDANTGRGIADAQLSAIAGPAPARSDSTGRFALDARDGGVALVLVRRLGYVPHVFTIALSDAGTREYVLELERAVPVLDTVTVRAVGRVAQTRLDVFEMRRRTSIGGHFITRADMERRPSMFTSDVLLGVLGVHVTWDQYGRAKIVNARGGCAFRVGLDGVLIADLDVDEIPRDDIHGIEIHNGPASVPPEYLGSHGITCGLIMIWTR